MTTRLLFFFFKPKERPPTVGFSLGGWRAADGGWRVPAAIGVQRTVLGTRRPLATELCNEH